MMIILHNKQWDDELAFRVLPEKERLVIGFMMIIVILSRRQQIHMIVKCPIQVMGATHATFTNID